MPVEPEESQTASRAGSSASPPSCGTLVICTRNRPELLRECLKAVELLNCRPIEVILVDNTDGDPDTRAIAEEFRTHYCVEPVPGLSRARNRGLAEATSDIVAFLDDDAVPSADWLGLIMNAFKDSQVAAATGKIVTPETNLEEHVAEIPRTLNRENPLWLEISSFGGIGLGSNMALRKTTCGRKHFFDERLGRGAPFQIAEEHHAFAYLISRGFSVRYLPEAVVYHPALSRAPIAIEARNSIAYFLLLLKEFPSQRMQLLRFLFRRLRKKPLSWTRDTQQPGDLVSSSLPIKLKAAFAGLWLYLKTPQPRKR